MSHIRRLVWQVQALCYEYPAYSHVTQANRLAMLTQMATQLLMLGYKDLQAREIKGRHIDKLLRLWREQGISDETLPNRLSTLRWWCRHVGRPSVMPKTNTLYGLTPRRRVALVSKAISLGEEQLTQVDDPYIQMSLRLQQQWGLRREESLKIKVGQADQGDRLVLQGSWCKNGRPREIGLYWPEQRDILDKAKALVRFKSHSLIPQHLKYHQQRNRYDLWAKKLTLDPLHGLRHQYAQRRYEMLSGMLCPVNGGPSRTEMTPAQQDADRQARQQVSAELGHNRLAIVGLYIGAR